MSRLNEKVADLQTITGCAGGFVVRDGHCLASSLPSTYDGPRLERIAAALRKLAAVVDRAGHPGADFVLRYIKATLLVVALGDGAFLVLACHPDVSLTAIEVFAFVAADDVREALEAADGDAASLPPGEPGPSSVPSWPSVPGVAPLSPQPPSASSPPFSPQPPPASSPPLAPSPEPTLVLGTEEARRRATGLLGRELATAKALLIAEVGPIGDFLFRSALDAWLSSGAPEWRRAHALRDALATEIDDPKARALFARHPVWGG